MKLQTGKRSSSNDDKKKSAVVGDLFHYCIPYSHIRMTAEREYKTNNGPDLV